MGQFFYNFADSDGLLIPNGFSRVWSASVTFPCATDAQSISGGVLCNKPSGQARAAITPDDFTYTFGTTPQQFTMLARMQANADLDTGEAAHGFVWRVGNAGIATDDKDEWIGNLCYIVNVSGNWRFRFGYYNFTTGSSTNEAEWQIGSRFDYRGIPCFMKVAQLGNTVYSKFWRETIDTEPGTWQHSFVPTYPTLDGDSAGLYNHSSSVVTGWWDYLGIGTDGDDPPTEPVTPPAAPGANPILIGMDF